MQSLDSYHTRTTTRIANREYTLFSLRTLGSPERIHKLPFSLRILLENLLRHEDGRTVCRDDIDAVIRWKAQAAPDREIAFMPARVLLQDFTGVPCVVDLAVMRDAIVRMGGDPDRINPIQPVDLVIDHSVQVDEYGTPSAFRANATLEFERNRERYAFLRWGQHAFGNFRVVPPDTGIVHQVNLEYLARVVFTAEGEGELLAYPDTLVGTDSHTTMINGLGVLGWGVGGIEAEAAMLGQPISMLIPQVFGFRLTGKLPAGATATDAVLTVTQILRKKGVVGSFVEFFGPGLASLSLADRATIANMAPEYGATMGFFPVDDKTLEYLSFTGRSREQVDLIEKYLREQLLFLDAATIEPIFSDRIELDLGTVEPSLAGPKRPQDRVRLSAVKTDFRHILPSMIKSPQGDPPGITEENGHGFPYVRIRTDGSEFSISHGSVVIAAITSCTNTSNPAVMIAAGLLAKKAVEFGLASKPWVKTSLAPGSKVVTDYLREAGLSKHLDALGFHLVGYGCTTCIGNSGPLPEPIARGIQENDLVATAVLSGNRNFEGRVNPHVRANYLASPPLVVAYAIAGTIDIDLEREPLGIGKGGNPVYLKDVWPPTDEIDAIIRRSVKSEMFRRQYGNVFEGDETWKAIPVPTGARYGWEEKSTYIKAAPFFDGMPSEPNPPDDIKHARVLALLGDSVTTDHISPAGSISVGSPAGQYLIAHEVDPKDFNSYGARRGNHEVMVRGTFANIRLRNLLAPGTEGGWTVHPSSGDPVFIYDAAMNYQQSGTPLLVIAGKEYGSGSSRDWAAKGPRLLGVRAVLAESFERIHRSNLVGLGILPLQFLEGESAASIGLDGFELYDITGIANTLKPRKRLEVSARKRNGQVLRFEVIARIDTPNEVDYYRHDGILRYVLRTLLAGPAS